MFLHSLSDLGWGSSSCVATHSWVLYLLTAMELALSLEKLVNEKLLTLHQVRWQPGTLSTLIHFSLSDSTVDETLFYDVRTLLVPIVSDVRVFTFTDSLRQQ